MEAKYDDNKFMSKFNMQNVMDLCQNVLILNRLHS